MSTFETTFIAFLDKFVRVDIALCETTVDTDSISCQEEDMIKVEDLPLELFFGTNLSELVLPCKCELTVDTNSISRKEEDDMTKVEDSPLVSPCSPMMYA